jgi:peptide/nickel transport system ATP-binding protein
VTGRIEPPGTAMTGPGAQLVLSVRNLSVTFRVGRGLVEAVRGVSFDVARGETLAIVGESGSGKSTTAAAVNRLLPGNGRISSGEVWFDGRDLVTVPESQLQPIRGARIGLVPQDPMSNLNPMMRVGAQIAEALEVHGIADGRAARDRAVELLAIAGIGNPAARAQQYPHEFSGGMRQRVLIAIGLACRPELLIADEPTSALDVTVQRRILDQLDELTTEMGTAVVLITHDLGLAAERADRVLVMYRGQLVEQGAARELLTAPQHDYTTRLLDAAPSVSTRSIAAPRGDDTTPLVVVSGLRKQYTLRGSGEQLVAVDDVSFTIGRGETVSIVGESGSGKSTTATMLLALEPPTAGSISFGGDEVTAMGRGELFAFRRRVQPVFQNPYASLDPRHTVGRSIAEPLQVHRVGTKASRTVRVSELLEQVSLPASTAARYPHELSGGQRQRVAIARAMALAPELIVLDEAVSALDVLVQAQILELLARLQADLGVSYLFISHDLAVVRMISHRVHVMQSGRIVESGAPDDLFEHPQTAYTAELLAAIPGPRLSA